jgi:predicted MFS family arabinose efflux permease
MLLFLLTLARGAPDLAAASIYAAFNIADSAGAWLGGPVAFGSSSAALRRMLSAPRY